MICRLPTFKGRNLRCGACDKPKVVRIAFCKILEARYHGIRQRLLSGRVRSGGKGAWISFVKEKQDVDPFPKPARAGLVIAKLDPTLRITKFRNVILPKGPFASTHYHDCMELGLCYEGKGVVVIDQRVYHCGPGDVVLVWPGQLHMGWALEETIRWKFFNFDLNALPLDASFGFAKLPGVHAVERTEFCQVISSNTPHVKELAAAIFDELQRCEMGFAAVIRNLLSTLMVWVRREIKDSADESSEKNAHALIKRLQPAITRMAINYSEPQAVDVLARLCCMSERTFRRTFHAAVGTSPIDYLYRLRMNTACALLAGTNLTVAQVGERVGHSPSDFSRCFRRLVGESPKAYREKSRQENTALVRA
jgi:AraC family transcriptional activator of mtrCDE